MKRETQMSTVTVKNPNVFSSGEELEVEDDYVSVAVSTVKETSATSDKMSPSFTRSFLPVAVSWVILVAIMALRIHFTSVISENNIKLKTRNQELETRNQELETQRNNLTEQIQNTEIKWNEQNVTRAQWSVDAYCPIKNNIRQCKPCQDGWLLNQSSCYAINNPKNDSWRTWEEAREDCRGKISDLAVIDNEDAKKFISDKSWKSSGTEGYWIGLRVEDGRWKWINGSDLTDQSWIDSPTNGSCAISVLNEEWKSVSCEMRCSSFLLKGNCCISSLTK
ncbi:hypothetical protein PAMP_002567 [Pampus punctatissimus]